MGLFNTHICRNCFQSYQGKPEVCPHCGAEIEYKQKKKQQKASTEQLEQENQILAESQAQSGSYKTSCLLPKPPPI